MSSKRSKAIYCPDFSARRLKKDGQLADHLANVGPPK